MNEKKETLETRLLALFHQARDERDEKARTELNALLRENSEARKAMSRLLLDEQALISHLRSEGIVSLMNPAAAVRTAVKTERPRVPWRRWPSFAAAAVGMAVGLLFSPLVLAVVGDAIREEYRLNESFENPEMPLGQRFPRQADLWSGDLGAPIEATDLIRPQSGNRMVPLPAAEKRKFSYAWRLYDLNAMGLHRGGASLELEASASFIGSNSAVADRIQIRMVAFAESPEEAATVWLNNRLNEEALVHVAKMAPVPAGPKSWKTLSATMSIPANARTVLVSFAAGVKESAESNTTHYLDDVMIRFYNRVPKASK